MARVSGGSARRAQVGRGQRWTVEERRRYLREFARSGLSAAAFVRKTGLPQSTFDRWRHQARHRRVRVVKRASAAVPRGFARVEVMPATAATGLTLVVRRGTELTAELTGLDGPTAVAVIEAMLRERSR